MKAYTSTVIQIIDSKIGLSKEKKAEISNPKHLFQNGESWLDVKFRSLKFLKSLQNENYGNYAVLTHGGFICSMLYCFGYKNIMPHGTLIGLELGEEDNKENKNIQIIKEYEDKLYINHNKLRNSLSEEDYNKYNEYFDENLKRLIKKIDFTFTIPDLEEEF